MSNTTSGCCRKASRNCCRPRPGALENCGRELLDLYRAGATSSIIPPFIEYLESLLTGTGHDLDLQTFKLTDQLNGRMMGVRADMTPQAARIDAHRLQRRDALASVLPGHGAAHAPGRFCRYPQPHAGRRRTVRPRRHRKRCRDPRADAGDAGADGHRRRAIDLGHVGIFRGSGARGRASTRTRSVTCSMPCSARRCPKSGPCWRRSSVGATGAGGLAALAELNGGEEVLDGRANALRGAGDAVVASAGNLSAIAAADAAAAGRRAAVLRSRGTARLSVTRPVSVFAAFVPGRGQEIARGGRYDDIGQVFGRARPATGFSTDLRDADGARARADGRAARCHYGARRRDAGTAGHDRVAARVR